MSFANICGRTKECIRLAADLRGLQVVVQELAPEDLESERNRSMLAAVAGRLGGQLTMETRMQKIELCPGAEAAVVLGDPPRMILTVLVEAFGETNPRRYVDRKLVPYLLASGVLVLGGSSSSVQLCTQLDAPRQTPGDPASWRLVRRCRGRGRRPGGVLAAS